MVNQYVPFVSTPTLPSSWDTFRWATVTDDDPLAIRLDGDVDALPLVPDTLITGLTVGQRVWTQLFAKRIVVLGASEGTAGAGGRGIVEIISSYTTSEQVSSTSETDLSGYSITFTAIAGHLYRVIVHGRVRSTVSGDTATIRIREGTTNLGGAHIVAIPSSSNAYSFNSQVVLAPTAGETTYKVSIERNSGTGSVYLYASSGSTPIQFYVEDLGLAAQAAGGLPGANHQVEAGTISLGGINAGASTQQAVTFDTPFVNVPVVVVTPGSSRLTPAIEAISTTGFTAGFNNWTAGNASANTAHWQAMAVS